MIRKPAHRLLVAMIAALGITLGLALPAKADADHPDIFTFEAHRTAGANVSYSGQYAKWDAVAQAYVNPLTKGEGVQLSHYDATYKKRYGNGWDDFNDWIRPAADGTFRGSMKVYPGAELHAVVISYSAKTGTYQPTIKTPDVVLPYYAPMPVVLVKVHADQTAPGAKVFVVGEASASCISNAKEFGSVLCSITEPIYLQSKIDGKWTNVHKSTKVWKGDGGIPSFWLQHPKGHLYRWYLPGTKAYKKTYSRVWTTSAYKVP